MFLPVLRLLMLALVAGGIVAQSATVRRTCRIGRIADDAAPVIDGILTDACWQNAPAIGQLVMVEPWLGRKPSDRTIVKLLHDRSNLYISIWCEQDPATVVGSQRLRDARLGPDDRIELMFDPFENRRTAYYFQVGAGGSIGDACHHPHS